MKHYWRNKETGEMLTYSEMLKQGAEMYGLDDDTSLLGFCEYYDYMGEYEFYGKGVNE